MGGDREGEEGREGERGRWREWESQRSGCQQVLQE